MEPKDPAPGRNKPALNPASAPAPKTSAPPPTKPLPSPAAGAPPSAATPEPAAPAPQAPAGQQAGTVPPDLGTKLTAYYNILFTPGSPHRRYGPLIVAVAVLFFLLLGKCAITAAFTKSPEQIKAAQAKHLAETTGTLVVKSNRPNTMLEAMPVPAAPEAAVKGAEEGAAEQTLAALPPGKYTLTARSEGWPDLKQDVQVDAARTTEVTFHFKSGALKLDTDPTGTTVRLGKLVLGKTPLLIPQLPAGECQLTLEYQSWAAVPYKTVITENQETAATVHLPHGKLTVDSVPAGATVVLEHRSYQKTPLFFDPISAGPKKVTLQMKDFPPLEVSVTVVDGEETKIRPALGTAFPVLDPAELLRAVWLPDDSTVLRATTGIYRPKNDVVKNLRREWLYNVWLRKIYRLSGPVKSYDAASGRLEFAEQKSELARYRVVAQVKAGTKSPVPPKKDPKDKEPVVLAVYGRLTAVEEPAWPARVITFELSDADFLPEETP